MSSDVRPATDAELTEYRKLCSAEMRAVLARLAAAERGCEQLHARLRDEMQAREAAEAALDALRKDVNAEYWNAARDDNAALRDEVERLRRALDAAIAEPGIFGTVPDANARAHSYAEAKRDAEAARDDAQAKLRALCEKGVDAEHAVRRYGIAVDWDNALHEAGCGCAQCELRGAFYRFRDALDAADPAP